MEVTAKQYTIMFSNTSPSSCKRSTEKRRKKEEEKNKAISTFYPVCPSGRLPFKLRGSVRRISGPSPIVGLWSIRVRQWKSFLFVIKSLEPEVSWGKWETGGGSRKCVNVGTRCCASGSWRCRRDGEWVECALVGGVVGKGVVR
ncbi:hypothetical protein Tco_1437913 [Tanacetum coccineum]